MALRSPEPVSSNTSSTRLQRRSIPKARPEEQFIVEPIIAFYIFAFTNILAALFAPIQDCDEVFNYWEPTHYLNRGYGLQTWEYSPEFSLRSWLYIVLHAVVGKFGSLLSSRKSFEFYFIRVALALTCAFCQSRLFNATSRSLNPRIAFLLMIVMSSSPGMFHASVAYLPSSFAMYTSMLGMTSFLDGRSGSKTHEGIMWFGIGGIIGWPFATALIGPFLAEELLLVTITKDYIETGRRFLDGIVRCAIVLALQISIEAFFYHKLLVVPWNLIFYNIFSPPRRGPEIFGTEPFDFYFRNLLLNFNVWFVLALLAGPVLVLQYLAGTQTVSKLMLMRSAFFVTPFYMWLAIFSAQPHKEERFMYPAYPFLALNAAFTLHAILVFISTSDPERLLGRVRSKVKLLLIGIFVILAIDMGLLRILGMVTAYRAPLQVYSGLQQPGVARLGDTICLGKEWYRFPSSYHLPNGTRAKFVKSAFNGLLPGEFHESIAGFGLFSGTWLIPPGMNDQNIPDPGKYIDVAHCSFMVDSFFPGRNVSTLEPDFILDSDTWEKLQCHEFLDTAHTSIIGRLLWLPQLSWLPQQYRRQWGQYCLLRRRKTS